jgi:sec-independent protein translocase protein TatC
MATETDESCTDEVEQEEEGGPIKPFLEHLEDLRWVLIKCGVAVGLAILVCLLAGNLVVKVLMRPLERTTMKFPTETRQVAYFILGTNKFPIQLTTNMFGTNRFVNVSMVPVKIGDTDVLGLKVEPDVASEGSQKMNIPVTVFGPATAFLLAVKVALYAGIALASPFLFYFIMQFVFPALKLKEKKYVYRGLFFGLGLFAMGVCFCYFVLMPLALAASVQYSTWLGFGVTQWRAEDYISFVCKFLLGMGVGFELPVVVLTLVKIGILNYTILSKARRYVIVINFILGAMLTTPEVLTQVCMAIPLQLLYEISVWIAWYWERKEKKAAETQTPAATIGA